MLVEEDINISATSSKLLSSKSIDNDFSVLGIRQEKNEDITSKMSVALIDSGVDMDSNYQVRHRVNFLNDASEITYLDDESGHGTSIANVMTEINPNIIIESLKVLDESNYGKLSSIVSALYWCIDHKIKIVNMSFSTKTNSKVLHKAIKDAHDAGLLMIAATGNDGNDSMVEYPAAYPEVIAVGGVDWKGKISEISSGGNDAEVMGICENVDTNIGFSQSIKMDGTSLAVPQVSAVASLLWEKISDASADYIRALLDFSKQKNGVVDYQYAIKHINDFDSVYEEDIQNESHEISYDENDNVSEFKARWAGLDHQKVMDKEITGLTADELKILRVYAKVPDYKKDFPDEIRSRYLHALPCNATATEMRCNYVSVMRYLFRIARYMNNGKTFKEAYEKAYVRGDSGNKIENSINKHIKKILSYTNVVDAKIDDKKKLKVLKVLGAALHVAGDTYAHRVLVKKESYPLTKTGKNNMFAQRGTDRDNSEGMFFIIDDFPTNITTGGINSSLYQEISQSNDFCTQVLDYRMKDGVDSYADSTVFCVSRYTKGTKTAMQEMVNSWKNGDTTMNKKVITNRGGCKYSLHKSSTFLKEANYE